MAARPYKLLTCERCGVQVVKRPRGDRLIYCTTCAVERARLAALAMSTKSGPDYEAWLRTNGPRGVPRGPRRKG